MEKEYLNILYASADDPTSRLKMTNKRSIQVYERSLNRRLEGNAAVNETDEQANIIDDISAKMAKTTDLTVHLVTPESSQRTDLSLSDIMSSLPHDTALKRPGSDISAEQDLSKKTSQLEFSDKLLAAMTKMESCANTLLAALSGVKAKEMPSLSTSNGPRPSVAKKRKRVKDPKSGSNAAGRNCLYCGKPKSQMAGERNLHYTHIKRGEPGYFYCPEKVSKTYGTPPTMTFEEFQGMEHWESEMEVAKVRKEKKEKKKAEAEEQRQRHGWKKPGNPKGYKFAK